MPRRPQWAPIDGWTEAESNVLNEECGFHRCRKNRKIAFLNFSMLTWGQTELASPQGMRQDRSLRKLGPRRITTRWEIKKWVA
ncbi:MAG: hypothetical protein ACI8QS_000698 [Planctomycetota bacterium]|jgi:hypothetical protein